MIHKGYHIRPGTMDDYVVNEIPSYRHLPIEPTDVVLDIGGNIGSFAKYAADKCAKVVSIEPDPENFALLCINSPKSDNRLLAVVGDLSEEVQLYKNLGKNKGLHSTVPTRGREVIIVKAINMENLLAEVRPTKIKLDCEGAEYSFLRPENLPTVKAIILEYNLSRRGEQEAAQEMHRRFLSCDWICTKEPRFGTKAWATLACYTTLEKRNG